MNKRLFAVSETAFATWGRLAFEQAAEAGFSEIEITDGGGYIQVHPLRNGYVEYERMGLDLSRKDSYPLSDREVREYYLRAAEDCGLEIAGARLALLETQGFALAKNDSPKGRLALENIEKTIQAAADMGLSYVSVPIKGMFFDFQHAYAEDKILYAVELGDKYGVQIFFQSDASLERQLALVKRTGGLAKIDLCAMLPPASRHGSAADFIRGAMAADPESIGIVRLRDFKKDREGFITVDTARPALLGEGDCAFAETAAALRESGYRGRIFADSEYFRPELSEAPGADEARLAKKDLQTLELAFPDGRTAITGENGMPAVTAGVAGKVEEGSAVTAGERRFKFGVCEWAFPVWGDLALKMAAEAGFDGVQLGDAGGYMNNYPLRNPRVQAHYLEAAEKYGIELPQIHLYSQGHMGFFRSAPDSAEGKICRDTIEHAIIAASEMGIPCVIIDGMRMTSPAKYAHVLSMANFACDLGEKYGIQIAMETDLDAAESIEFIDLGTAGRLKLCFDAHNPCMYGTGYPPDMIRALGAGRIDHLHLKDNIGQADGFITIESELVPFGSGKTFFRESAEAARESGLTGWVVSENMYYQPAFRAGKSDYIEAAHRDLLAMREVYTK